MILEAKTIELRKPVKIGKGEGAIVYDRLELVEPTAAEYTKAAQAGDSNEQTLALIQIVCKVPKQVVDSISLREMLACDRFFAQFLSDTQKT